MFSQRSHQAVQVKDRVQAKDREIQANQTNNFSVIKFTGGVKWELFTRFLEHFIKSYSLLFTKTRQYSIWQLVLQCS